MGCDVSTYSIQNYLAQIQCLIRDTGRKGLAFENWHTNYRNLKFLGENIPERNSGLGQELLVLTF